MATKSEMATERLEAEIMSWSGNIASATAQLLAWIADYDRREGWKSWGCRSCAQWLSWKCSDSLHTAREKVRVARALELLPLAAAAMAAGELSYSKVRALTRVATATDDAEWVDLARHSTGAELDRVVTKVRQVLDRDENADARVAFARRQVARSSRGGGLAEIDVVLPVDMVETVMAAVEMVASQMVDDAAAGSGRLRRDVIAEHGGIGAIRADALVRIAEVALATAPAAAERGDVGRLSLVVDSEVLREVCDGDGDGESTLSGKRVAPEVARRWACDTRASVVIEHDGHGYGEGRESRVLNRRLRRALHRRDNGRCRFPGCDAASWLHAHHIVHWADGGHTALANLVSLCTFHHHTVHEGGWQVAIVDDVVVWSDPAGVPATVEPLQGSAEAVTQRAAAAELSPRAVASRSRNDRLDFGFVVSVIYEHCRRVRSGRENVPAGTSRRGLQGAAVHVVAEAAAEE